MSRPTAGEVIATCLRWHTAHTHRLEIGAELRRDQLARKQRTGFGGSDSEISRRLTAAKRKEFAALRALAKLCAEMRCEHQRMAATDVFDIVLLTEGGAHV